MKYVIMFASDPELDAAQPPERVQEDYARIYRWFQDNASVIDEGGAELQPVETATTVRHDSGDVVVVDGPFSEAREVIGGFSIIDVPDMDAAIALVKTWPSLSMAGSCVEIRPMVTDYGQFE